jgi:hypothetical protein
VESMRIGNKEQNGPRLPRTACETHCLIFPLSAISLCLRLSSFNQVQMPSFSLSSIVRTADTSLLLDITHVLVQNSPSDIVHIVHGNFPEDVDVLLASDLVITLLGTLDRVKISSTDIEKSAVVLHFKRYLQAVRKVDENHCRDIYPKMTCVECWPARPEHSLKRIYR